VYIIPEFAFDSEAVNYKTERLVAELQLLVEEMKAGGDVLRESLSGLNKYIRAYLARIAALTARQDDQAEQTQQVIGQLLKIETVLKNGFRLKE
jgi:hypothetical protein